MNEFVFQFAENKNKKNKNKNKSKSDVSHLKKSFLQYSLPSREKHFSVRLHLHSQHCTHFTCQARSSTLSRKRSRIGLSQPAQWTMAWAGLGTSPISRALTDNPPPLVPTGASWSVRARGGRWIRCHRGFLPACVKRFKSRFRPKGKAQRGNKGCSVLLSAGKGSIRPSCGSDQEGGEGPVRSRRTGVCQSEVEHNRSLTSGFWIRTDTQQHTQVEHGSGSSAQQQPETKSQHTKASGKTVPPPSFRFSWFGSASVLRLSWDDPPLSSSVRVSGCAGVSGSLSCS